MRVEPVALESCRLQIGELGRLTDYGYFHPEFDCRTLDGSRFTARMRLHVTEPLDPLVIVDPRAYDDGGVAANSAGSRVLARRFDYTSAVTATDAQPEVTRYRLDAAEIARTMRAARLAPPSGAMGGAIDRLAVTCHDPQQVGGGNTVLFRYTNWLAWLGVPVTVYSCGRPPTWMRVQARFRQFDSYAALAAAIEEPSVLVYSIWHIEPLVRHAGSRRLISLRQGVERFHYGIDAASSRAAKPVIDLLESLTDDSLVVSPYLEGFYRTTLGIRSHLVPNGIDLATFARGGEANDATRDATNEKVVLSVGDPSHFLKGAHALADALCRVAEMRPDWRLTWRLIGGEATAPIDLTWSPPGNLTCARVPPRTAAEMRAEYRAADVFVNPSLTEGFGLPSLEAMACGRPVVQADNGGLTGIAVHDTNCLMVPAGEAAPLAAALERCLGDDALAQRLAEHGRRTASAYSQRAQFDAFVDAFSSLTGRPFDTHAVNAVRANVGGARDGVAPPLVSVVIPTYNQAAYLPAALDSLLAQTYPHWEAVVVNDGSTDTTADVLASYAARDGRIRPVTQANGGITAALNAGLAHARGDYFCWLSSDDLFYPDKLRLQIEAFDALSADHAIVYGGFDILHDETGQVETLPPPAPLTPGTELAEAFRFDFIDGCSVMIRMTAMREVGGFNARYRHAQDMELWMRLAAAGLRFHVLTDKLNVRRVHQQQSSTTNMIHCRYDAAAVVAFYLDRYRLSEVYPYLELGRPDHRHVETVFTHAASRAMHVEANVNFPLNRARYVRWLTEGVRALPLASRRSAVAAMIAVFRRAIDDVPFVHEYLDACLGLDLDGQADASAIDAPHDRRVAHRSIVHAAAYDEAYARELYDYAMDLLLDERTPLVAQTLTFHGTNRLVDTRFKLAHSVLRYLAQFPNPVRARVAPFVDMSHVPPNAEAAARLVSHLSAQDAEPSVRRVRHGGGATAGDVIARAAHWLARERPLVSVLIPAYNHARFLPAALDSLRAQTYGHWDAIVVDDGSTDDTEEVAHRYARGDSRIRAYRKANGGVASALNEALRHASGEWICWLSADDLFEPDKLSVHVSAARTSDARAFFTRFRYLDERSGAISEPELWQPAPEPAYQVSRHLLGPYIHGNSVAVHRSVFERVGVFDERAAWAQDYDMWLRISAVERWQYLPARTCITRLHEGQSTHQFPEAGQYEGAFVAGGFLNAHAYPAWYPFVDLTSADGLRVALRDTSTLARTRHAMVHRCGYNTTLIEQLADWLARACPASLRDLARRELAPLLRWLPSIDRRDTTVGDRLRDLLSRALDGSVNGWRFLPRDPGARAGDEVRALRTAGDAAAAAALERYLDSRATRQRAAEVPPASGPPSLPRQTARTMTTPATTSAAITSEPEVVFDLDHVKTAAIFGAGRNGALAAELAQRCGWTVCYVVDNNAGAWGTTFQGLPVKAPQQLTTERVDLVLIASQAHLEPIARQLDGFGFVHGADYVSFLAPIQVGSVRLRVTS